MTEDQPKGLEAILQELPAKPGSYSYEGQIRPTRGKGKGNGYVGQHIYSVCGDKPNEARPDRTHRCIGSVIAKDEDTAAILARLIDAAPDLLAEVVRLRAAFTDLADVDNANRRIVEAEECGGDGIHCAVREAQYFAQKVLGLRDD